MKNQYFLALIFIAGTTLSHSTFADAEVQTEANVVTTSAPTTTPQIVGGDKDSHGCIGSAGYTWSAPMKKCIRTWEYYSIDAKSPSTGIKRLDAVLQSKADGIISRFRWDAESNINDFWTGSAAWYALDISYTTVNTWSITSVLMETYEMLGGAHGNSATYSFNYNQKTRRLISVTHMVPKKKFSVIEKNVRAELTKKLEWTGNIDFITDGTSSKKLANYRVFAIHTDTTGRINSITFYFDPYQVAPYAAGRQSVTLSYPSFEVIWE